MRRRRAFAEEQTGNQTATATTAIVTREVSAARIKTDKGVEIPVAGNIAVTTEKATGSLLEIGNDNDIGFVVACARLDPGFPLTHVIGRAEICVPVGTSDFQTPEFVDQEEVNHAGDRVRPVHSRSAILEDVYVIDH